MLVKKGVDLPNKGSKILCILKSKQAKLKVQDFGVPPSV